MGEQARNRPKCLYDFAAKNAPRIPSVLFSGEMRTRSQFNFAFSSGGAKKNPKAVPPKKRARVSGGF